MPPGFLGASRRNEVRIDYGVLNIAVAEPVLHKPEVVAGFEQVRCYRVFERVEV